MIVYGTRQGQRQGISLEGAKLLWGSRGQRPLVGVRADAFLVLKS